MKWYQEFKKFFSTGVFYIGLGGLFLYLSNSQIDKPSSHPSFIFFLAILGVAIVLYGTGTQAVGKGKTGTVNVAIAGGAGVLALVLGFGVVMYNERIQKVFASAEYYAVIRLEPDKRDAKLEDYLIGARLPNSQPLHLWKSDQEVQILVPVSNTDRMTEVTVFVRKREPDGTIQSVFNQKYEIKWSDRKFKTSRLGKDDPEPGEIGSPSESGHNVRFRIDDRLFITQVEDVVVPDGDFEPIRIIAQ